MNVRSTIVMLCIIAAVVAAYWWQSRTAPPAKGTRPTAVTATDVSESEPSSDNPLFEGLDPDKEKFIWDAEHFTFELETHIGSRIVSGLKAGDAGPVAECLAEEFRAQVLQPESAEPLQQSGLTESITKAHETDQNVSIDGSLEFAEWLTSRFDPDDQIQAAKFRVLHISRQPAPASSLDAGSESDVWQLQTLLTQKAERPDGTIRFLEQDSTLLCRFSNDDQIQRGHIIQQWKVDAQSIRTGPPLMREVTADVGLKTSEIHDNWTTPDQPRQYNKQMAVADFDRDGFPDVAVATIDRQVFLFRNQNGQFRNVATECGLPEQLAVPSMLVTWLDFNNDGYVDLLVGNTLYANRAGESFESVSRLDVGFNPMGSAVADYDCDGLVDLYIVHQYSEQGAQQKSSSWLNDDEGGASNQLWRNLGDGRFVEMTGRAGVAGGRRHSFAAVWFHANEDHYPDLYVANDFARNSFFLNRGDGSFDDVSEASRTADFATSMGVAAGDLNGDGDNEIYVANMYSKMGRRILAQVSDEDYPAGTYAQLKGACAGNRLYRRTSDGPAYEEVSDLLGINAVGWAYAPALTDFDMDGRLDIYATAGFLSFRRDKPDG